jgi:hypothetical protein
MVVCTTPWQQRAHSAAPTPCSRLRRNQIGLSISRGHILYVIFKWPNSCRPPQPRASICPSARPVCRRRRLPASGALWAEFDVKRIYVHILYSLRPTSSLLPHGSAVALMCTMAAALLLPLRLPALADDAAR